MESSNISAKVSFVYTFVFMAILYEKIVLFMPNSQIEYNYFHIEDIIKYQCWFMKTVYIYFLKL